MLLILMKKLKSVSITLVNFCLQLRLVTAFCNCNLERCQVKLFLEGLESYGKKLRKSSCSLRKNFTDLCEKYRTGFRHCIAIAQNKLLIMKPRPNNNSNEIKNG